LTIKNVANGRLSDRDVIGILATNQGGSIWNKEKVETATDPNTPQVSLYTRKDGKLFAAYIWSIPVPCLIIGTKRGGEFLLKQQSDLTRYIKI
jgi:hypothetical protein